MLQVGCNAVEFSQFRQPTCCRFLTDNKENWDNAYQQSACKLQKLQNHYIYIRPEQSAQVKVCEKVPKCKYQSTKVSVSAKVLVKIITVPAAPVQTIQTILL